MPPLTGFATAAYSNKEAGMVDTTRTRRLVGSLRHLRAGIFVLSLLVSCVADYASSQGYTIDKTRFQASTKDFPGCKLKVPSSFLQKAINLPWGEFEIDVVQLDDRMYCIHLQDAKTLNTQSLIISDYDFLIIYVHDVMYQGQLVPRIQFRSGFLNIISIAIMDGKFVLI